MQHTIMTQVPSLKHKYRSHSEFTEHVGQRFLDKPVSYQKAQTPHELALKYQSQVPKFDTDTSKYELNY